MIFIFILVHGCEEKAEVRITTGGGFKMHKKSNYKRKERGSRQERQKASGRARKAGCRKEDPSRSGKAPRALKK